MKPWMLKPWIAATIAARAVLMPPTAPEKTALSEIDAVICALNARSEVLAAVSPAMA